MGRDARKHAFFVACRRSISSSVQLLHEKIPIASLDARGMIPRMQGIGKFIATMGEGSYQGAGRAIG